MSKNSEYAAKYADAAMEQMKRYGIPASVTLAQGILESRNGQSELSQLGNNHFGIKATKAWLNAGGDYLVYDDDKPNEKFCKYNSVADSYEHHSKFLAAGSRYAQCFKLSPDDYKGWTKGIERAGYATNGGYAKSLQSIIEANNLQKYDQQVMTEMREQGKNVFLEIETKGTATVLSKCPDAISIFLMPPSMEALESRIRGRRTEAEEVIQERLAKARAELPLASKYKYVVLNDTIERASQEIASIIKNALKNN